MKKILKNSDCLSLSALGLSEMETSLLEKAGINEGSQLIAKLPEDLPKILNQGLHKRLQLLCAKGYAKKIDKETLLEIPIAKTNSYGFVQKTFGHDLIFGKRCLAYRVCGEMDVFTLGEFVLDHEKLIKTIRQTRGVKAAHALKIFDALIRLGLYTKNEAYLEEKTKHILSPNQSVMRVQSPVGVELNGLSAAACQKLWIAGIWKMRHILQIKNDHLKEKLGFSESDFQILNAYKRKHHLL